MLGKLLKPRNNPPSERVALAYEIAVLQLSNWLNKVVRNWEKQTVQRRKLQLILFLTGLLLLGSLSVYYTATGHFFTRITKKSYEQYHRRK